jgi:hypothetical protein
MNSTLEALIGILVTPGCLAQKHMDSEKRPQSPAAHGRPSIATAG